MDKLVLKASWSDWLHKYTKIYIWVLLTVLIQIHTIVSRLAIEPYSYKIDKRKRLLKIKKR